MKMRLWHIIVLTWLSVFAASCGNTGVGDTFNVSPELVAIDSLMWRQPDSAFAMLQEFASSATSDSLDEFNGHYCQLLVSELLYKNYYAQSNRKDLKKAVGYFDSIDDGFLAARAHYIRDCRLILSV